MSKSSNPIEPGTARRPIATGRIVLAIALLAAFAGGQWALLQLPVDVDLPPDASGGALVGHRGLQSVSLLLHGAATLDASATGSPLQRLITDAASLDPATHQLVVATGGVQPPPGGMFSYRMEAVDGSIDGCQTSFRWRLDAGTRLDLLQDSLSQGCDVEMQADRVSTLRLTGTSIDPTRPGCFRVFDLGNWRDQIQDPLTVTVEIPADTSIRWQFVDDGSAVCAPFDSTSLRLRRAEVHDGHAIPASTTTRSKPGVEAWIAGTKSALTVTDWRLGAGAMELDLRGEGRIESRGRLQTDNRLDALMGFPPFARTLAIILDLGLLAWIARLVLGRRDHGTGASG